MEALAAALDYLGSALSSRDGNRIPPSPVTRHTAHGTCSPAPASDARDVTCFIPNIYNEDWLFVVDEAVIRRFVGRIPSQNCRSSYLPRCEMAVHPRQRAHIEAHQTVASASQNQQFEIIFSLYFSSSGCSRLAHMGCN
jgi:hypothetical protein